MSGEKYTFFILKHMLSQQQRAASYGEEEAEQEGLRGHLKVMFFFLGGGNKHS